LANGGKNTLTLTDAAFTDTAGMITIDDGNAGNLVDASTLSSGHSIVVHAGGGANVLTGGAGNDVFFAGGNTTMTGSGGANEFVFGAAGNNLIKDFAASSTNELVFSDAGFNLGLSGASSTPTQMTAAEVATLFTFNTTGKFGNPSRRFAYDTKNGELFASSNGSSGAEHLVATLSDHAAIAPSQLFLIT
jgi:Ca2+-binding RTX toxin-like protein